MYWNARLNAAGKQCGFWNSDPQHSARARWAVKKYLECRFAAKVQQLEAL
jgi:hypothetical protein